MTRSFHLHRHVVMSVPLTVLLHCPITSVTRALVDNQSRTRILNFVLVLVDGITTENEYYFKQILIINS